MIRPGERRYIRSSMKHCGSSAKARDAGEWERLQ
jgi:hypothetical protein